jgi:hypothetical protein
MKYVVFVIGMLWFSSALAQTASGPWQSKFTPEQLVALEAKEDTLALLAYGIVNDSFPDLRFAATRTFIPSLVEALKTPNSFRYPFERLQSVSIQYPSDSSFRIFTWQLYVDTAEYHYYGAIQMNTPDLKLFPLRDRSASIPGDVEQATLSHDQWFGSLYYNIREAEYNKEKYYVLFGYDAYSFFRKRKVMEVLSFREGKPVFGAPVFVHQQKNKPPLTYNRRVLTYAAESTVRLNFDESLGIIIHDNLIEMPGLHGEGNNHFPDGSYQGYKLEKGLWLHIDNVFTQTQDVAPRPYPVLDKRNKDIFGRN